MSQREAQSHPREVQGLRLTESEVRQNGLAGREIKVEGEVDLSVSARLRDAIERAPAPFVLVDLTECEFIDTSAIATLLAARRDGLQLLIHSPAGQVRRVLEVTGLTADGLVFADRAEALGAALPAQILEPNS